MRRRLGVILGRFLFMSIGALDCMRRIGCVYARKRLSGKTVKITILKRQWGRKSKLSWAKLKDELRE